MSIRISIVDPNAIKIALEARKTLDGNIMIMDHLHVDIIIDYIGIMFFVIQYRCVVTIIHSITIVNRKISIHWHIV